MKLPTDKKSSSIITDTPPSQGEFPPQTPPDNNNAAGSGKPGANSERSPIGVQYSPATTTLLKYLKRVREDMANYIDELDDRIRELEKEVIK